MTQFADYADKYPCIRMRREDGILEMTFHTEGESLRWNMDVHSQFEQAFLDVGRDKDNEVVIMTGVGEEFSGPPVPPGQHRMNGSMTSSGWDHFYWEGKGLLMNLLAIEVPVIAAINGPALRHAEIPVLSDIVLAADTAAFQDTAHFSGGLVPGDGMHIVFPLVMGVNRGRYFLLTGQRISAAEALDLGVVNEVLPKDQILDRAWHWARQLCLQPRLNRRYARVLLTHDLKKKMHELLGYGLALEGAAVTEPRNG